MRAAAPILFAASAYLAWIMLMSNKDTVKANSIRAQILDIDLDWRRIRITLNVQNPTAGNLVVRSIVGDLYVNGDKVANVSYFGYVNIPANGQNHFNIEGKYIQQNVGKLIYDIFSGRQRFELQFRGSVNVNSELIPFSFNKTMN